MIKWIRTNWRIGIIIAWLSSLTIGQVKISNNSGGVDTVYVVPAPVSLDQDTVLVNVSVASPNSNIDLLERQVRALERIADAHEVVAVRDPWYYESPKGRSSGTSGN